MANTAAKKITYDNKPVQVESAIRDGTGLEIASNYAKKATTLSGYGITDANINTSTGTITLGSNSITPLSSEALQNYVTLNTAQTITEVKTFSAQNYFYGLNVGGNSLSLESSDMRFYATRKFGTDNNKNLSNIYVYDGNEKLIGQRQMRLYTDYVVLRENLNTTNHSAQTELCVVESTGESYFKAPYRTSNLTNDDVLTAGNGVTLGTAQTIPGEKTFTNTVNITKLNDSGIIQKFTQYAYNDTISSSVNLGGIAFNDKNGKYVGGCLLRYYTTGEHRTNLECVGSDGATRQLNLYALNGSGYVTAPYRTSNLTNDDVLTAGNGVTLGTEQVISGHKIFYNDNFSAIDIKTSRTTSNIGGMNCFTSDGIRRTAFYGGYISSTDTPYAKIALILSGTNEKDHVFYSDHAEFLYRTSNLTDNDVLTKGNGVTLGTAQTITAAKTFSDVVYIQSNTGSYREGLRINRSTSGWATIVLGATQNSTSGLSEGWSINRDTSGRLLMSAKDSTYSTALFYGTYDSTASKHTLTVPGNFVATQKEGSVTKTYTTGADTNMNILARVNNYTGNASCRIRVEVSGSNGIKTMYINAVWAGRGLALTIESVYDVNNCFRYVRTVVPNNTSYYTSNPPEIQLQQVSALARTVKATILESSGDVVLMDNLTTVGNTTNRNNRTYDVNNTIGIYDNVGYVQNAGWSNGAWDTIDNDRFKYGEAVVAGSISAMGSDGLMWKLRNTAKEFRLPLVGGRSTGAFAVNNNYGRVSWSRRGIALTELTDATIQGTAFTVPTWAVGNTIYARGSLSNGNFKPDGTLSNTMAKGYTWVPIGKVEKINSDAISYFSVFMMNCSAYTLDSNGKLTHIDGKQIYDSGNTDTKVRQTLQTGNYNFPLLMSYVQTSDTTSNRDGVSYRNNSIYANPSTGNIQATKFNDYILGAACARDVTTNMTSGSTALFTSGGAYTKFKTAASTYTYTDRSFDTVYHNDKGVPIFLAVSFSSGQDGTCNIYMGSTTSNMTQVSSEAHRGGWGLTLNVVVPIGWYYKFTKDVNNKGINWVKVIQLYVS